MHVISEQVRRNDAYPSGYLTLAPVWGIKSGTAKMCLFCDTEVFPPLILPPQGCQQNF
jgi:hypothetical protein